MSYTYGLDDPTDRDYVRLLIHDTVSTNVRLQNEEIDMILTEETARGAGAFALKYFAAARCLELLQTRWLQKGEGVLEKEVDELRVRYTALESGSLALENKILELRKRGAEISLGTTPIFKVL